ncbi:amidinotransferase [Magnetococcales bacterium HHB-1]
MDLNSAENLIGSHNEWDPLVEVIVGHVDDALWPAWDKPNWNSVSPALLKEIQRLRGHWRHYPVEMVENAKKCYAELITILEGEGVRVRRPEPFAFNQKFQTPHWRQSGGFCAANPRDSILVIGQLFLECPMSHRARYYETFAFRSLMKEYSKRGAAWIAAPKPELKDELYDQNYQWPEGYPESLDDDWSQASSDYVNYSITEAEPVFDAADFVRCGRDIFGQRSHLTNQAGIDWLRRLLEPNYRLHILPTRSAGAYHIDTTFMPLAPGKVLVNPNFLDLDKMPSLLKSWDLLVAPQPSPIPVALTGYASSWMGMNVLMLDAERVIVEREQEPLIRSLKDWGFKPIPCTFKDHYPFLGGIHCATLDVWRRGELKDYF